MWVRLLVLVPAMVSAEACARHHVGDKYVEDVFSGPDTIALANAACEGDANEVAERVGAGVDVNVRGLWDITPLFWALTCRSPRGVEALLVRGADANARMDNGWSPAMVAATYDDPQFLRLVLRFGGDPSAISQQSDTSPLHKALGRGFDTDDWTNYYILLDAGADVNRVYPLGDTIAYRAIAYGRFSKVLELVVERGYSHDLAGLRRDAQTRPLAEDSDEHVYKQRLIEELDRRLAQGG